MDVHVIKGKIYKIFPLNQKSDRFQKREIVLSVTNPTDRGTYVEFIKLQFLQEKVSLLDGASKGDFAICKYAISGRKMGKGDDETFYTNLDVQDMSIVNKTKDIEQKEAKAQSYSDMFPGINSEPKQEDIQAPIPNDDDLPF